MMCICQDWRKMIVITQEINDLIHLPYVCSLNVSIAFMEKHLKLFQIFTYYSELCMK